VPAREPPVNRCLPHGVAPSTPAPGFYAATTCVDHRAREGRIAKTIAKRFHKTTTGSSVQVFFECDPLVFDTREVVIETGSGHGGSLTVWRLFRHTPTEDEFHVLGIGHRDAWRPYDRYGYDVANRFDVVIARGRVSAKDVKRALETAKPALTAGVRELQPPPRLDGAMGLSSFSASADFHSYVRIVDDMPHKLERHYSGYPGSSGQSQYLGLEVAMEALRPLLEPLELVSATPSSDEREFFTRELLAAQPRLHGELAWWVRERYVRLAGRMGTTAAVPPLLEDLRAELGRAEKQRAQDRNDARLIDLVVALVQLTGWDARFDEAGKPRPVTAVAQEYLSECNRALASPGGSTPLGKDQSSEQ